MPDTITIETLLKRRAPLCRRAYLPTRHNWLDHYLVRQGEIISPSWYRLIGYNTVCISIAT